MTLKLVYKVAKDRYSVAKAVPMARAPLAAGSEFDVITPVENHGCKIESLGYRPRHGTKWLRTLSPTDTLRNLVPGALPRKSHRT